MTIGARARRPLLIMTIALIVTSGVLILVSGGRASADAQLTITTDVPLVPSFSPAIHDYAVRCTGSPLVASVDAPPRTLVSVDHARRRSGAFSATVPLDAGQEFSIVVRHRDRTSHYYVRCLPSDFPAYSYSNSGTVPKGMFTVDGIGNYLAVFNTNGVPLWWMKRSGRPLDSQVLPDGTVGFWDPTTAADEIYSLSGQPVRAIHTVGSSADPHELELLPNGDYLVDTYAPRNDVDLTSLGGPADATVLDGEIQEISPTGQLVWSWNSSDHLSLSDTAPYWSKQILAGGSPYDIVHLNSVAVDGNELVVSMRYTDAVWGIDRSTGDVLWKLGGTPDSQSLTVHGDPQGAYPFSGQHDARMLPGGMLTVHDNDVGNGMPPRAVEYAIDQNARTATMVDSISDPNVTSTFCCGSVRTLQDGSWLIGWGDTGQVTGFSAAGTPTFTLDLGNIVLYRAVPVPKWVTAADVRAGMDAQYPRTTK